LTTHPANDKKIDSNKNLFYDDNEL